MASGKRDEQLLRQLGEYVEDAKAAVTTLHSRWDSYRSFYHGDHTEGLTLTEEDQRYWVPINLVFSHLETRVPILLDSAPLPYVVSSDTRRAEDVATVEEGLQALWIDRRVVRQYKMTVRDQLMLGSGAMKAWWNPTLGPLVPGEGDRMAPAGDVDVSWQDPYAVFPDPSARSLDECEYLALSHDLAGDRAKRLWPTFDPEKALKLEPDGQERRETIWDRTFGWVTGRNSGTVEQRRPMFRVWEVYHDAGKRLTVYSKDQILFDGDNPTPHERYPVVIFTSYEHGYGFWGISEVEQTKWLQQKINLEFMRLFQHSELLGNSGWLGDDPTFQPDNRPGKYNMFKPGHQVIRDMPASLPNWVFMFNQKLLELYDTITGVHDVTRGLRPGSVQSGIGIQQLQETAMTRLRDISRDNTVGLRDLAQLMLAYMQGGYQEPRTIGYMRGAEKRQVTVEPAMLQDVAMNPEDLDMQYQPDDMGLGIPEDVEPELVPADYRVVVESSGELPLNAMARMEKALRLAQTQMEDGLPAIDRQALLDEVSFARRSEVMERIERRQQAAVAGQAMAQDQMMQQQGMMGAGQPGMMPGEGIPQGPSPDAAAEILATLEAYFSPEEMPVLESVLETLMVGGELNAEQEMWLAGLEPDQQEALASVLSQLNGAMGPVGPDVGTMAPPGGM